MVLIPPSRLSQLGDRAGLGIADVALLAGVDESTISRLWSAPDWLDRVRGRTLQALIAAVPGVAEYVADAPQQARFDELVAGLAAAGVTVDVARANCRPEWPSPAIPTQAVTARPRDRSGAGARVVGRRLAGGALAGRGPGGGLLAQLRGLGGEPVAAGFGAGGAGVERLAKASADDHPTVVGVLSAFVREHTIPGRPGTLRRARDRPDPPPAPPSDDGAHERGHDTTGAD